MTRDEIFQVWAPASSPWSRWTKPLLFSRMVVDAEHPVSPQPPPDVSAWTPRNDGRTGLVVDLPKADGVAMGIALARAGFRPVALYNALPGNLGDEVAVQVYPILWALEKATNVIRSIRLPDRAPPAFLLDSRRRGYGSRPAPRTFDNRSISLPGDFPTGTLLMAEGIQRMIVVQFGDAISSDLRTTLYGWQLASIQILVKPLVKDSPVRPVTIPKPSALVSFWHSVVAYAGYRRRWGGGFGDYVPSGG